MLRPCSFPFFKALAKGAGLVSVLVGVAVLLGWLLDNALLKSIHPSLVAMKTNTALGFLLSGVALWLKDSSVPSLRQRIGQACAGIVVLLGLLTLVEYLGGGNLGIDQLLFEEPAGAIGTLAPNRMAPASALSFLFFGVALLLNGESRRGGRLVFAMAVLTAIPAMLSGLSYLYGATNHYGIGYYTQMAVHTALGFLVLAAGILCLQPERGLIRLISRHDTGGVIARRLLPATIVLPVLLEWSNQFGWRTRAIEPIFGAVFVDVANILLFSALIVWLARSISRADSKRNSMHALIVRNEELYRSLFDHMLNGFAYCRMLFEHGIPQDFIYLKVNAAFETLTGLKNVVGRKVSEVIPGARATSPELFEIYGRVSLSGKSEHFEIYLEALKMWFSISVYSPEREYFVAVFEVITERKRAEYAARASQAETSRLLAESERSRLALLSMMEEQQATQAALSHSESRFRALIENASDITIVITASGLIKYISPSVKRVGGYDPEEVLGRNILEFVHPDDLPMIKTNLAQIMTDDSANTLLVEARCQRKDGPWRTMQILTKNLLANPTVGGIVVNMRDITERRLQEKATERLNRIFASLSHVNKIAMRVQTQEELFVDTCRVLVDYGQFKMAWIGWLDTETGIVVAIAQYGDDSGYLRNIRISANDEPIGRGPTGTSVREGRPYICNDFFNDPCTEPWREAAAGAGFKSSAALPLYLNGVVSGALTIYAAEAGFFGDTEMALMEETARDISFALDHIASENARKQAEESLRLADRVFQSTAEGIVVTDADANIVAVNPAFELITGYRQAEVLGKNPNLLQSGRQDQAYYRDMWATLLARGQWHGEIWNRRKSGEVYPEWLNISAVRDIQGRTSHYVAASSDITSIKLAQQQIEFLTHHDALTGLPNRTLLKDRLAQGMQRANRENTPLALLYLGLDHFKNINETLGHAVGDTVLQEVARRLTEATRAGDTLARLGGDEFVLLLEDDVIAQQATVARKLLDLFTAPIFVDGNELAVTASIGISIYPDDGADASTLLQHADQAMHNAKAAGRNTYRFFDPALSVGVLERLSMEAALRRAMVRNELLLHYQPQVDLYSGEIVVLEALLRWRHPEKGLLLPAEFIPLAEETDLIVQIGAWVLQEACRQLQAWHATGHARLCVSVNVSALQFTHGAMEETLAQVLRDTGLNGHFVELELTESLIMFDYDKTKAFLKRLKALGVGLAVDNFGLGHSSLSYLKHFPIDKLKIDKSFIGGIVTDRDDAAIVQAMIAMGHSLQLKMIAEGVESEAQAGYLRTLHCDLMQGFYFSHPLPAGEIPALLSTHETRSRSPAVHGERVLLLVDDEVNVLSALKRLLRHDGYHILTATSAEEGLQLLAKHPVGVLLSDQRMPGMSGIDLLSRVKVMYPKVIRMILSGYTDVNSITEAINSGEIYKFITKPWEDEPLREVLKEAFMNYETKQTLETHPRTKGGH